MQCHPSHLKDDALSLPFHLFEINRPVGGMSLLKESRGQITSES